MKRALLALSLGALTPLALLAGCGRQDAATASAVNSGPAAQSPPAPTPPRDPAEAADRRKSLAAAMALARREHPDWSAQQLASYMTGYEMMLGPVSAETIAKTRAVLDGARSLRCQFPRGSDVDLADPTLARHEHGSGVVTFDAIDRQRGHARVIADAGAGDVAVFTGPAALTFVETGALGNPMVTVVFPRFRAGTREFYAADSQHTFALGDISIGQYYGTCTILE